MAGNNLQRDRIKNFELQIQQSARWQIQDLLQSDSEICFYSDLLIYGKEYFDEPVRLTGQ